MTAITHQNNSIIANSMRILNSIIDGSTTERDRNTNTNRSSSLHNLHVHSVGSDPKLSLSLRTLQDASTRPGRNLMTISSDQSPLWTALTTTVQISVETDS
jgi:hypothetical protein